MDKKGLDDMPKLHKRELLVNKATAKLHSTVLDFRKEYDLTDIEYLQWLASETQSVLKYMLRFERHGDYDTPSGLEK